MKKLKKALPVILIAILGTVAMLSLVACNKAGDAALSSKVQKLEVGFTQDQVKGVLGTPDEDEMPTWHYYGGEYKSLIKQEKELENKLLTVENENELEKILNQIVELEQKMSTAEYPHAKITFDGDRKLSTVVFDVKVTGGKTTYDKEVKSYELFPKVITMFINPGTVRFTAKEKYADGSYYMGAIATDTSQISTFRPYTYDLQWRSHFGGNTGQACYGRVTVGESIAAGTVVSGRVGNHTFSTTIDRNCTPANLQLDIVLEGDEQTLTFDENADTYWKKLRSFITGLTIPANISLIERAALDGCNNLKSITVADGNERYRSTGNCLVDTTDGALLLGCANSVIPDDGRVTSIAENAFKDCGLTSLAIPASVTSIDKTAFSGCAGLESITVADGNQNFRGTGNCLVSVSDGTLLLGCNGSVIPNDGSVTSIADEAFRDCTGLTSIAIPANVASIGINAFRRCTELTAVTIDSGTESIGTSAFRECKKLESVTVGDGLKSIADYAFSECKSLASVNLPQGVTHIGESAFEHCKALVSIVLPEGLKIIPRSLFFCCTSLTSVTIPEGVTHIESRAFESCGFTSVTLPSSLVDLGNFQGMGAFPSKLTDINFNGTKEQWNAISNIDTVSRCTIHCTDGVIPPSNQSA